MGPVREDTRVAPHWWSVRCVPFCDFPYIHVYLEFSKKRKRTEFATHSLILPRLPAITEEGQHSPDPGPVRHPASITIFRVPLSAPGALVASLHHQGLGAYNTQGPRQWAAGKLNHAVHMGLETALGTSGEAEIKAMLTLALGGSTGRKREHKAP